MNSLKSQKASRKNKRRPASALRPNSRRTRNDDAEGLEFMGWVKTLPCVACFRPSYGVWMKGDYALNNRSGRIFSEFAHIGGNSAAKANNMHGIPLCTDHHRSGKPYCQEVLKGKFGAYHGIDTEALITRLVAEFRAQRAAA